MEQEGQEMEKGGREGGREGERKVGRGQRGARNERVCEVSEGKELATRTDWIEKTRVGRQARQSATCKWRLSRVDSSDGQHGADRLGYIGSDKLGRTGRPSGHGGLGWTRLPGRSAREP